MNLMKPCAFLFLSLTLATPLVHAAPPAGHPSPAQANDLLAPLKPPALHELPNSGKVVTAINANEYTYLEISSNKGVSQWIAAPLTDIKVGTPVRYEDGAVMTNFYSKLLKRTFSSVMFVNFVLPATKP